MVTGLPQIVPPNNVCEECIIGKQHREQFPQAKSWRAKKVLELVHSDICGPINPSSNGCKWYFITFIDDYSRKTWVYFLQEKLEALIYLKASRHVVKIKLKEKLKLFALIVVESIVQKYLKSSVVIKA